MDLVLCLMWIITFYSMGLTNLFGYQDHYPGDPLSTKLKVGIGICLTSLIGFILVSALATVHILPSKLLMIESIKSSFLRKIQGTYFGVDSETILSVLSSPWTKGALLLMTFTLVIMIKLQIKRKWDNG